MSGTVTVVSSNSTYSFTKPNRDSVTLLAGLGVEGDVHAGVTVKHRSRVAQDPTQPNLRQVHLIHEELFEELREAGFEVAPGISGRTSPRAASISSASPSARYCTSVTKPSSRSPACATRACRSTISRTAC